MTLASKAMPLFMKDGAAPTHRAGLAPSLFPLLPLRQGGKDALLPIRLLPQCGVLYIRPIFQISLFKIERHFLRLLVKSCLIYYNRHNNNHKRRRRCRLRRIFRLPPPFLQDGRGASRFPASQGRIARCAAQRKFKEERRWKQTRQPEKRWWIRR